MKINPYEFTQRAEFGTYEKGSYDANGQASYQFNLQFKLWFGFRQQTLMQQYNLEGLEIRHTKLIAIRHSDKVFEGMYCRIKDAIYKISSISADERNGTGLNAYDVLTIQAISKRGVST